MTDRKLPSVEEVEALLDGVRASQPVMELKGRVLKQHATLDELAGNSKLADLCRRKADQYAECVQTVAEVIKWTEAELAALKIGDEDSYWEAKDTGDSMAKELLVTLRRLDNESRSLLERR